MWNEELNMLLCLVVRCRVVFVLARLLSIAILWSSFCRPERDLCAVYIRTFVWGLVRGSTYNLTLLDAFLGCDLNLMRSALES